MLKCAGRWIRRSGISDGLLRPDWAKWEQQLPVWDGSTPPRFWCRSNHQQGCPSCSPAHPLRSNEIKRDQKRSNEIKWDPRMSEIKHSHWMFHDVTSDVKARSTNIIFHWGEKDWQSKCSYDWQSNTISDNSQSHVADMADQWSHTKTEIRRTRVQNFFRENLVRSVSLF